MFAARLPAFACGLFIAAAAVAHKANAAEEESLRAKSVLAVAATAATPSNAVGPNHVVRPTAQDDGDLAEDWTEPRRVLLGVAALFVFFAYRRGRTD